MVAPSEDLPQSRSVAIDTVNGKWIVTIIENLDTSTHDFEIESFARSFADGQRYRLGLAAID